MSELVDRLAACIDRGKINADAPYPPDMKGQDGASELTQKALAEDLTPAQVLRDGLTAGMRRVGDRFERGEAFIPDLLIAAQAMNASMEILKPYFARGDIQYRGKIVLGTVAGDLHDIGKNIVRVVLEGNGWEVIDLGVDVTTDAILEAVEANPGSRVGLSALLTTTMANMRTTTAAIRERFPGTAVYVGGAPLTAAFSREIGADGYFPDPHKLVKHLAAEARQTPEA